MLNQNSTIIALDVGSVRIGVAVANMITRMASPYKTVANDDTIIDTLQHIFDDRQTAILVVGLPRNLNGDYTAQTHKVEAFAAELEKHIQIPLYWQDEAATSVKAEAELDARKKPYAKGDVDALAATYILDDFLHDNAHMLGSVS
jgi:putative holliday junction resolvase